MLTCTFAFSQNTLKVIVKDSKSHENLIGVSVYIKDTAISGITDNNGFLELSSINNGEQKSVLVFQVMKNR